MKRLLLIFALLGACSAHIAQAYIYSFSNHTDYPLKIKLQLAGVDEPWETREIGPRGSATHHIKYEWTSLFTPGTLNGWKVGFCLQNMRVETPYLVKQETIDDDGNKKTTYAQGRDNSGKPKWNPERNVIPFAVKNEAYNAILDAGSKFADGAVEAAAAAASVATGVPVPAFKVSGMTDAVGTWVKHSWCASRHFDIIEDAEESKPHDLSVVFLVEARG